MNPFRRSSPAVLAALLLHAAVSVAAPKVAPADLQAFTKALPAPGPRNREFLDVAPALLAHLGIDPASLRSVDPGLACDLSSKAPRMFEATLGAVGHIETLCTTAGWSQGMLTLQDGSSYVTTCGNPASSRVTATLDVTVGEQSSHSTLDSAPRARMLSHTCSGWNKVPG